MEPRASTPPKRLEAIRLLNEAGIPAGVMTAPMIPELNDMELERILDAAHADGARGAGCVMLRLPGELKELWREWLQGNYPDRAARGMKLAIGRAQVRTPVNHAQLGWRILLDKNNNNT